MLNVPGKVNKYAGGNAYCPRPTPEWQKGIGAFIVKKPAPAEKENSEPMEDGTETVATPASSSAAQGYVWKTVTTIYKKLG